LTVTSAAQAPASDTRASAGASGCGVSPRAKARKASTLSFFLEMPSTGDDALVDEHPGHGQQVDELVHHPLEVGVVLPRLDLVAAEPERLEDPLLAVQGRLGDLPELLGQGDQQVFFPVGDGRHGWARGSTGMTR
jgi:hypothetical protein